MAKPEKLFALEQLLTALTMLQLPFILIFTALKARFHGHNSRAPGRAIFDRAGRFVMTNLSTFQLQAVSGTCKENYIKWAKKSNSDVIVDELAEDARHFWVGPSDAHRVLVYCHGGGFMGPLSDFQVEFWATVRKELAKIDPNQTISVAVLQYTIFLDVFPKQLLQLMVAMDHLSKKGVDFSQIYLARDSAGANLILQLLAHTLHPVPGISSSPLQADRPLGGACLVSPWVDMSKNDSDTYRTNDAWDILPSRVLRQWSHDYLHNTIESQRIYADVNSAPPSWFEGVQSLVRRILITAGSREVMLDDIVAFNERLEKSHSDLEFDIEKDAVHADPLFDAAVNPKELSLGTRRIISWLHHSLSDNHGI